MFVLSLRQFSLLFLFLSFLLSSFESIAVVKLDSDFGSNGRVVTAIGAGADRAQGVVVQSDGNIVVGGFSSNGSDDDFALIRYLTNGNIDTSFGTNGVAVTGVGLNVDYAWSLIVQQDDKLVLAGRVHDGTNWAFGLVRYNADGSLDMSFDSDGKVITVAGSYAEQGYAVIQQSDGKLVMTGVVLGDFLTIRYNSNGSLATSFGVGGKVVTAIGSSTDEAFALVQQSDGKLVVVGQSWTGSKWNFAIVRYLVNGSLDLSFDLDGKISLALGVDRDSAFSVLQQTDGKLVIGGWSFEGSNNLFALLRLNQNGSLDASFGGAGKISTIPITGNSAYAYSVIQQVDEKLVLAGWTWYGGNENHLALVRYNQDGSLDTSFDTDGIFIITSIDRNNLGQGEIAYTKGVFYLAGDSYGSSFNKDFLLVKVTDFSAPSLVLNINALNYTENDPLVSIDAVAQINDADGDSDWNGGTLVVQITSNNEIGDQLSIANNIVGNININALMLFNGLTLIGSLSHDNGVVNNAEILTITFNNNATNSLVQQTLRSIQYKNNSETPSSTTRTITITATDQKSEFVTGTRAILVTAVNDAPTGNVIISGAFLEFQTLNASNDLADLDGLGGVTYTWNRTGVNISSGVNYVLTEADIGQQITVEANYVDGASNSESVVSGVSNTIIAFVDTEDYDNDGLNNGDEISLGTNLNDNDTDNDGVLDGLDIFPLDSSEWLDTDLDGIGDNLDAFPLDATETIDTDNDSIGNNTDTDDDGDGMPDIYEMNNGLDPLVDDAADDIDSDGISNYQEYLNSINEKSFRILKLQNGKMIVLP